MLGGWPCNRKLRKLLDCQRLITVVIADSSVPYIGAYCCVFLFLFWAFLGSAGSMARYIEVAFASWFGRVLIWVWHWWLELVW